MLQPVLTVCAVITVGSLITIGIAVAMNSSPYDARGNPLSRLDPREVEAAAQEPYESPRLMSSL